MNKKALWMFRILCILSLILFGTMSIIGSGGSSDGDDDKSTIDDNNNNNDNDDDDDDDVPITGSLEGVWKIASTSGYDEFEEACVTTTADTENNTFLMFSGNEMSRYYSFLGTLYTCPDDDTTFEIDGETFTEEGEDEMTFDLSGETLTVTANEADAYGCIEKTILTKVSESDIENAEISCGY